ncbi:TatD family hydrolase [Gloeobacter kilaueensis]|uniref:D-aminoacyl-tRNA deacylase n=1 Tax=Gloeobacter kilaueensis (strain ATCC BAA-2537 / CCAP 1431/1 / ULC 316 / JS1) TaxID=1183438 RepID=U5QSN6_GLOK1|nr:TatD family hydrolase [Gloeobacter kilaueensis]AGY60745.1 hydrolase, TatD family [Gloeobacter kilaueensis JS1]
MVTLRLPGLIDTHVHINYENFRADLDAVAANWRAAGVVQLVHACVKPEEFPGMQALADRYPELALAVGLHPLDVGERWNAALAEQIRDYARSDRRVVAIGETGLDFFKADNPEAQEEAFRTQIAVARELDLPVIIHCRDAALATRRILEAAGPVRGVMHCWGGTPEETGWFVDLGMYVSFSGIVTFKNAQLLQQAVSVVPDELLLIETDCPFLAPVPKRGKRNEPAYVAHVAEKVAELRSRSVEEIVELTARNARTLFRLPATS